MIKNISFVFIILFITVNPAVAEFKIPRSVYNISSLDKALVDAVNQNKPLTFLYSNKDTTCPLCTSASYDILYSLDKQSVIVYIHSNDWQQIPPLVQSAINSPSAGKYIPIAIITNAQIDKIIYIIPYRQQNRIVLIQEAKSAIQDYLREKEPK